MAISIKTLPNLSRCCLTIDQQVTPQSTRRGGLWVDSLSIGVCLPHAQRTLRGTYVGTPVGGCALSSRIRTQATQRSRPSDNLPSVWWSDRSVVVRGGCVFYARQLHTYRQRYYEEEDINTLSRQHQTQHSAQSIRTTPDAKVGQRLKGGS
jgi:hypothetical protein